jgi:hypothetical protein
VPVIVENKPGASGGIGAMEVVRAEPDGHTLMYISDGVVTQNPHTLKSVPYDPFRDFTPIAQLTAGGVVLVMHPSVPAASLQEFIAYGKANPGKLAYASFGAGTVSHIYGEVLRQNTGIDIVHIPYKGSAEALKDLLAGRVQIMFDRGAVRQGRPAADPRQRRRKAAQPDARYADAAGAWPARLRDPRMERTLRPGQDERCRAAKAPCDRGSGLADQDLPRHAGADGLRPGRRHAGRVRQGRAARLRPLGDLHPAGEHSAGVSLGLAGPADIAHCQSAFASAIPRAHLRTDCRG